MFSAHCVLIIQSHLEATVIFKFSLSFPSDYLLLFLFFLKQILSLYLRQALNPWSLSISQLSKFLDWRCTSTHWAFPIWLSSHIFPFPSQNISSLISVHFCPKLKGCRASLPEQRLHRFAVVHCCKLKFADLKFAAWITAVPLLLAVIENKGDGSD